MHGVEYGYSPVQHFRIRASRTATRRWISWICYRNTCQTRQARRECGILRRLTAFYTRSVRSCCRATLITPLVKLQRYAHGTNEYIHTQRYAHGTNKYIWYKRVHTWYILFSHGTYLFIRGAYLVHTMYIRTFCQHAHIENIKTA